MPTGTPSIRRVLCATDLDAAHPEPLLAAHRWAQAFGAETGVVTVLSVAFPPQAPAPHSASGQYTEESEAAVQARALVATARLIVGPDAASFETFVEHGDPATAIVERARRFPADLIVVGSHDRRGLDRLLLGSVAAHVVRTAPCPVLVARSPARASGCVLAACDLQAGTPNVLYWAGHVAARFDERLLAAHAMDVGMSNVALMATTIFSGALPSQPETSALREAAIASLRAELQSAALAGDTEVLVGPAAPLVVARAEELGASLIVVGTHGRTGLKRLALGSVAEEIVRKAGCNVLVVR